MGFFEKLKNGLAKTKNSMMGRIESLLHSFTKIDEDLFEELRQKDVFDIQEVSFAIIETNGKMSILKKPSCDTVKAGQLGVQTKDNGMQAVIVSDGEIADSSMQFCSLTKKWLRQTLINEKVRLSDIFIMTADRGRKYNIIKKAGV